MIQRKKSLLTLMTMLLSTAAWSEVGGTFTSALTVNGSSVDVTYTILTESSEGNTCTVQGTYNKTTKKYKAAIATSTTGSITIPATVENNSTNYSVVAIGNSAFSACKKLTSVTLPSTIKKIEDKAFYQCEAVTSITLGGYEESIGSQTFSGCKELANEITLPSSLSTIGDQAFMNCTAIKTITNNSKITSIPAKTFSGCSALSAFTINSEVATIGDNAFANCEALTSLTIPISVTSIGTTPFTGCTSLATINVKTSTVTSGLFSGCSALTTVSFEGGSLTRIPSQLFKDCSSLTNITLPSTVTDIEQNAFENCTGLTSFTIPATVQTMLYSVFKGCTNLESVSFESGSVLTSIPDYTFQYCSKLASITVPSNVTSIGRYAFNGCSSLTEINFIGTLTSVDEGAFQGCSGLTSLTIPEGLTSIGNNAFADCASLTSLNVPSTLVTIGDKVFRGLTSLTSLNLPNATSMGESAFAGCTGLTEVSMPKMETIGANAFEGCTGLTTLTLPSTITSIGLRAFKECTNMVYIDATAATSFSPENATRNYVYGQNSPFWEMNNDDVVIYLADGVSPANCSSNVVLTSGGSRTCADFQFDAAKAVTLPYGFTATKATATRSFAAQQKSTVYLPFAIGETDAAELGKFYEFDKVDGDVVSFKSATATVGGKAYLFEPASALTEIVANNAAVVATAADETTEGLKGVYEETVITDGLDKIYFWAAADGAFSNATSKLTVPPTRAYLQLASAPAAAGARLMVSFDGEATGIATISRSGKMDIQTVYDLQGRRVERPAKGGLYIVGGKKMVF